MVDSSSTLRSNLLAKRSELVRNHAGNSVATEALLNHVERFIRSDMSPSIKTIALYWPIRDEPDLRNLLADWLAQNSQRHLALPVTRPGQALTFHEWDLSVSLTPGLYGIPEPTQSPIIVPDLIFTPCLGWQLSQEKLWRIGYGGGYYDRTMEKMAADHIHPLLVGVSFSDLRVTPSKWQPQAHDAPLKLLITDTGIISPDRYV